MWYIVSRRRDLALTVLEYLFINRLCEENNVQFVSLHEHFKTNKVTDKYFGAKLGNFNPYIIPGFRPSGQDKGRPKAGLAQLSQKGLDIQEKSEIKQL